MKALGNTFKWGLTSEITPPDYRNANCDSTEINVMNRLYIHQYKTLSYLTGQFDSNVRDLEGALKDINLLASMRNLSEITVEVAAEAIRSRKQTSPQNLVIPIEKFKMR